MFAEFHRHDGRQEHISGVARALIAGHPWLFSSGLHSVACKNLMQHVVHRNRAEHSPLDAFPRASVLQIGDEACQKSWKQAALILNWQNDLLRLQAMWKLVPSYTSRFHPKMFWCCGHQRWEAVEGVLAVPQVPVAEPFPPCNTFQTLANILGCWTAFLPASEEHHNQERKCSFSLGHVTERALGKGGSQLGIILLILLTMLLVLGQSTEYCWLDVSMDWLVK